MAAAKGNKYSQKYTQEMIDDLCEDLLDFAENSRNAHFAKWTRMQGKTPTWLYAMIEDYPKLAQTYEDAKDLMASKLVTSSIYHDDPNFNGTHAMSYMGVYNREYRKFLKWKAEIAKEQPRPEENKCSFNEWKETQKE